jgi:hypothetical protein
MNCLIDYIGLQDCYGSTSLSGMYINQLPGVELKMIDYIADEEQINYVGVWDDVQKRAKERFRNDVIGEFSKRYRIKTIYSSIDLEKIVDLTTTTAANTQYRGFTIELNPENDDYVKTNLQVIYIQTLFLYLQAPANTTIDFYDLDTNQLLLTKNVTGAAGWNTINVFTSFDTKRLYVGYDATTINSVKKDISKINNLDFIDNEYIYWDGCGCNNAYMFNGAQSSLIDPYTITQGIDSFGLSGIWSVKCQYDNIVCNNLEAFKSAWLYCLGAELMKERIYSSRLNEFTVFDRNRAKELLKLFEVMYRGGVVDEIRYDGELTNTIESINLSSVDCCLECIAPFTTVYNSL